MSTWRTRPEPIPESEIREVLDTDVVVVGLGYAGSAAFRAACEEGVRVIGIESQREDKYMSYGRDIGHINSEFLRKRGVPHVDPIEFYNEWMMRSGNRANPSLVMQYATKSGENFDWFVDMYTDEEMQATRVAFWENGAPSHPEGGERKFKKQQGNYKFWIGTARFRAFVEPEYHPQVHEVCLANHAKGREKGGITMYSTTAVDILKTGNRVSGIIAKNADGYIRINAAKAVILAGGDFGGNSEMCEDLLPDIKNLLVPGEKIRGMSRNGSSIKLGVWAGGRLEAGPIATMGGNYNNISGLTGSHGFLWLDTEGRRFTNENNGDAVFIGLSAAQKKRGTFYRIFDSNVLDDLQYASFAHMTFEWEEPATVSGLKQLMADAVASSPEPSQAKLGNARGKLYAANTIEEMADNCLKLTGETRDNFVASYYRYNEVARGGVDVDFGKDPELLRPLDQAPIFCEPGEWGPMAGMLMATCGGLLTDEYQNVFDENYDRIPGLYATGNSCGARFGVQYSTPVSGVCNGIAVTLGREAGIHAARRG